jgi:Leucine-rich repeat (LRR) protein
LFAPRAAGANAGAPSRYGDAVRWVVVVALIVLSGAACRADATDPETTPAPRAAAAPAPMNLRAVRDPDGTLVVHHGALLSEIDLAEVTSLDLAMSDGDQVGYVAPEDAASTCAAVDLIALAERASKLTRLRISGCQNSIHAGLSAFGPTLRELTLADIDLDGVTIGNLRQLGGLTSLTLNRVALGNDEVKPLRELSLQRLVLQDLAKDSELSTMLDLWPRTLREVQLEGEWAGHNAMLTLARAEALEVLVIRGTRVANFSLNQVKGLEKLRDVTLDGSTFNDNSPLYFRELPLDRFVCNCTRVGDGGLRSLRHSPNVRVLELRETQVTGEGLEILAKLDKLEEIVLLDRDLGAAGFANLAVLPRLRRLELSGSVEDPKLTKLGMLVHLQRLRLRIPELADGAAEELSKLTELRVLDIAGCGISDAGVAPLASLTALEELYLDGTRVTRSGLETLAKLPSLQILSLDRTDVVDAGVLALRGHPSLRELRLDGTLVTDASIETLLSLPALQRVSLARTVVSEAAVARLRSHPTLQAINIDEIRG